MRTISRKPKTRINDSITAYNAGRMDEAIQRFEEAVPPLARAAGLRNDLAVVQNNLGVALERTGRFTAAGVAYRSALEADSGHRRASESLARIRRMGGNPQRVLVVG